MGILFPDGIDGGFTLASLKESDPVPRLDDFIKHEAKSGSFKEKGAGMCFPCFIFCMKWWVPTISPLFVLAIYGMIFFLVFQIFL